MISEDRQYFFESFHTLVDIEHGYPKGLIERGWPLPEAGEEQGFWVFDANDLTSVNSPVPGIREFDNYYRILWRVPTGLVRFALPQDRNGTHGPLNTTCDASDAPICFPFLPTALAVAISCVTEKAEKQLTRHLKKYFSDDIEINVEVDRKEILTPLDEDLQRRASIYIDLPLKAEFETTLRRATAYSQALIRYEIPDSGSLRNFDSSVYAFCNFLSGQDPLPQRAVTDQLKHIESEFKVAAKQNNVDLKISSKLRNPKGISLNELIRYHDRYVPPSSNRKKGRARKPTFEQLLFLVLLDCLLVEPPMPKNWSLALDKIFSHVAQEASAWKIPQDDLADYRDLVLDGIFTKKNISIRKTLESAELPGVLKAVLIYFGANHYGDPDELRDRLISFNADRTVVWLSWIYYFAVNGLNGRLPERIRTKSSWSRMFRQALQRLVNEEFPETPAVQVDVQIKKVDRDMVLYTELNSFHRFEVIIENGAGDIVEDIYRKLFDLSEDQREKLKIALLHPKNNLGVPREWINKSIQLFIPESKSPANYQSTYVAGEGAYFYGGEYLDVWNSQPLWRKYGWDNFVNKVESEPNTTRRIIQSNQDAWKNVLDL
ncbi:MAG: hypothetical protein CL783_00235 [Chloroflexi bacterium]|nr:hypothetical protein [Chloroflexota bacterium]|tara:strand:+ start:2299 stop:4107 length:1809 start_codon:yes stop_codon:yes gene_type:complete